LTAAALGERSSVVASKSLFDARSFEGCRGRANSKALYSHLRLTFMSNLIEEYGLIGDGETAALVHRSGSIDWLCWPRFDSDACFAALLGTADNGYWRIAPLEPARLSRRYIDNSLILVTDFETEAGAIRLTDFMSKQNGHSTLVRTLQGLRGRVSMCCRMLLCFDYGSTRPWLDLRGKRAVARVGPDLAVLEAPIELQHVRSTIFCEFELDQSEELVFTLTYGSSYQPEPQPIDSAKARADVENYWRRWIAHFDKETEWPEAVRRSLMVLKAMIYHPTGGMIAAPTTSLPERAGGDFNWDYRLCWIRDAAFTLIALIDSGYRSEATRWRDWLLRAVAGEPDKMRIMYRVDGSRRLEEWQATWLPGYRWTTPVRIGNDAASQRQLDIFGELIDSIHIAAGAGIRRSEQEQHLLDAIVDHVEQVWRLPDHGIWETRGKPRHYVYSKVSAWVAIDRYVSHCETSIDGDDSALSRMSKLRDEMHGEICREGYDAGLGRFVEYYGGQTLDASLLLLPLLGFLPIEDERVSHTIETIERELVVDGLVHRRDPHQPHPEGAFLACTCWLADCQIMQGRRDAARKSIERVLATANDLGLLAEEYDVRARRFAGNFPQALSHLALVRTALRFSGAVTERGKAQTNPSSDRCNARSRTGQ
jgi:GH15 family glucan-1,4-alpha-glucosidase